MAQSIFSNLWPDVRWRIFCFPRFKTHIGCDIKAPEVGLIDLVDMFGESTPCR